jgi:hypothetical protein
VTPITNYEAKVFVVIEDGGHILTIWKVTWDEVVSGAAFTPYRASSGGGA